MQEALSRTSFIHDPSFEEMVRMSARKCRPPIEPSLDFTERQLRHCDINGRLIHVFSEPWHESECRTNRCEKCVEEYELVLCNISNLGLYSATRRGEEPEVIIPKHVIPIVAGYLADGRKALLPLYPLYFDELLTESDSPKGVRPDGDDDQSSQSSHPPIRINILCLRYPLDTYPRLFGPDDFMRGEGAGIDATGPYSWCFTRNLPHLEAEESNGYD